MALKMKQKDETAEEQQSATGYTWPDPAKPSAMLVPTYVRENRALAVTKRQVFYGLVVTVAVVVLGVVAAFMANIVSQGALDDAINERDRAQTQVDELSPIAEYYDGLEERNQRTGVLMANDVLHADLFDVVNDALPAGSSLTGYQTAFGVPCKGPDPFVVAEVIGCITITGVVNETTDVGSFVESLQGRVASTYLVGPFATSIDDDSNGKKFSVNVNFTPGALSGKYVSADQADPNAAQTETTEDGAQ